MGYGVRGVGGAADADARLLLLYTGGTIGMAARADGALVPLDAMKVVEHLRPSVEMPVGVTVASFDNPIDSAAMDADRWLEIADAVVDLAGDHDGIVVLHGTDTMAYTASALSFLLEGLDRPIVFTGAQRPVTEIRSDGRQNLATACELAAIRLPDGTSAVPEVSLLFDGLLLRANRATKIHADRFAGFDSPNLRPLARAGVSIELDRTLVRPPAPGLLRRVGGLCNDVASLRLTPALDRAGLDAVLGRPGLRGLVLEAYGAGNGPTAPWFLDRLGQAHDDDVVVLVTTQCGAGSVRAGAYATGAALFDTGAVPGFDLTFEAALTKLMVLLDRHPVAEVRALLPRNLAGELTSG